MTAPDARAPRDCAADRQLCAVVARRCLSDHGREARYPFLDEGVMDLLSSLPLHMVSCMLVPPCQRTPSLKQCSRRSPISACLQG